jgi:GH15 family glucan-1,4-alpha-glucosidase
VVLGDSATARAPSDDAIASTLAEWRDLVPDVSRLRVAAAFATVAGESTVRELLRTSLAVVLGLSQRSGGIVAAPTSSLPQWPASTRTWDYRYCWTRDAALAASALLRAGLVDAAARLAGFLGDVVGSRGPCSLVRVDGTDAPAEQAWPDLGGHGGARPVRTGNAAAGQAQLDVPGELLEVAWKLSAVDCLPPSLASAATRLADWLVEHWREPDPGMWEIRGRPRHYTHSRVMAASGLRCATAMGARGAVRGDTVRWARTASAIQREVLSAGGAALELHQRGGGADAALAVLPLSGFLPADHPVVARTLALIEARLDRGGLLERYEGSPDGLLDPCAPFVFPSFWMASALQGCGREPAAHIAAALAARGPLGLWGEVADPRDHTPLGNYPQVQSHAAFVLAAVDP